MTIWQRFERELHTKTFRPAVFDQELIKSLRMIITVDNKQTLILISMKLVVYRGVLPRKCKSLSKLKL